ncbi:MAG: hypothetical protein ACO23O_15180, partial [Ilumatobacteraceae bacterium]
LRRLQDVDTDLAHQVARVHGLAAALSLSDPAIDLSPDERTALTAETTEQLDTAGLTEPLTAYLRLVDLESAQPPVNASDTRSLDAVTTAVTTRDELADAVPQVLDRLDRMLVRWIRRAADTPLRNPTTIDTIARTMRTTADRLAAPHRYVNTTIDEACSTWATAHHAAGNAALGLDVLTHQHTTDRAVRAMCLEQLGRLTEAIDDYTAAKRTTDAVRCARLAGDIQRARQLHPDRNDTIGRSLDLLADLTSTLDRADDVDLLPNEIRRLRTAIDRLGRTEPDRQPTKRQQQRQRPPAHPEPF